jgi:hypothetical protein
MEQAGGAPIGWSGYAGGRFDFLDLKMDFSAVDFDQRMGEEPAVFVFFRGPEMASGAGHREIGDAFEIRVEHLVDVAGDDVAHAVLFRQFMDGVVRAS